MDLRRGRPLRLQAGAYLALSQLWAASGLDFDSYTLHNARAMDMLHMAHGPV